MRQMQSKIKARSKHNNKYKGNHKIPIESASSRGEQMDLVHDIIVEEEEDRISNLPYDIIHHILSFFDMKYAIQTSVLSKKWKHIWTSIPRLNLNSCVFHTLPQFAKFVKHVLSHRNHNSQVSAVELMYKGAASKFSIKSLVNYAYSHNVQRLTVMWYQKEVNEVPRYLFPQYLFSSHTLKHLTLQTSFSFPGCCLPKSGWDFPFLETLSLFSLPLGHDGDKSLNLFSKCVNLKTLTLKDICMMGLDIFHVCAPQLSNLIVIDPFAYPKVFNVVAPKLENLTLSGISWGSCCSLQFSLERLDSIEKVNLSLGWCRPFYGLNNEGCATKLLDLFQKLNNAKFLILDVDIIKYLSSFPDLLVREPCRFSNLKCLKINKKCLKINKQEKLIATMPTHVINYFIESSPNATIIMDLPQVASKRSREEVDKDTMARKVAKLEEEKPKQDEVVAQHKAMLEKPMEISKISKV